MYDRDREDDERALATLPSQSVVAQAQISSAVAHIQSALELAVKRPRFPINPRTNLPDMNPVLNRLKASAQRQYLAEHAKYEYVVGGTPASGPSIRAAEAAAHAYGNMRYGMTELNSDDEGSDMYSYAHDMESNVISERTFHVPYAIKKKNGSIDKITDPRKKYEMSANYGARRMRACILSVIPGDFVDYLLEECDATLKRNQKPLAERITAMLGAMESIGVTKDMIEKKFQRKVDALTDRQLVLIRNMFAAIKDGMTSVEEQFPSEQPQAAKGKSSLGAEDDVDMPPKQEQAKTTAPAQQEAPKQPEPQAEEKQPDLIPPAQTQQPKQEAATKPAAQATKPLTPTQEIETLVAKLGMSEFDFACLISEKFQKNALKDLTRDQMVKLRTELLARLTG